MAAVKASTFGQLRKMVEGGKLRKAATISAGAFAWKEPACQLFMKSP